MLQFLCIAVISLHILLSALVFNIHVHCDYCAPRSAKKKLNFEIALAAEYIAKLKFDLFDTYKVMTFVFTVKSFIRFEDVTRFKTHINQWPFANFVSVFLTRQTKKT